MSQSEENARAPLRPDGASDQDRIAQAVEREIEGLGRQGRTSPPASIEQAISYCFSLLLPLACGL
jgi:hypothetical protein